MFKGMVQTYLHLDSPDLDDDIDGCQTDVEAVQEYCPFPRYAIIVERNEDEGDAEQANEADGGNPQGR